MSKSASGLSALRDEKYRFTVETQGLHYSSKHKRGAARDEDIAWSDDDSDQEDARKRQQSSPPQAQRMAAELSRILQEGGSTVLTDDALERVLAGPGRNDTDAAGVDAAKDYIKQILGELYGDDGSSSIPPAASALGHGAPAAGAPRAAHFAHGSSSSTTTPGTSSWGGFHAAGQPTPLPGPRGAQPAPNSGHTWPPQPWPQAAGGTPGMGVGGDGNGGSQGDFEGGAEQPRQRPHYGRIQEQLNLLQNADQLAAIISVATTAATTAAAAAVKHTMQTPPPLPPGAYARMHAAAHAHARRSGGGFGAGAGAGMSQLAALGLFGAGGAQDWGGVGDGDGDGDGDDGDDSPDPLPQQRQGSLVSPHRRTTPMVLRPLRDLVAAGRAGQGEGDDDAAAGNGGRRDQGSETEARAQRQRRDPHQQPWLDKLATPFNKAGGDGGGGGGAGGGGSNMRVVHLGMPRVTARTPPPGASPPPGWGQQQQQQERQEHEWQAWQARPEDGGEVGHGERAVVGPVAPVPFLGWGRDAAYEQAGAGRSAPEQAAGLLPEASFALRAPVPAPSAAGALGNLSQQQLLAGPPLLAGEVPAGGVYVTGGQSIFARAGAAAGGAAWDRGAAVLLGPAAPAAASRQRRGDLPDDVKDVFRNTLAFIADPDRARAQQAHPPPSWAAMADVEERREAQREADELLGGAFDYAAAKRELDMAKRTSRLLQHAAPASAGGAVVGAGPTGAAAAPGGRGLAGVAGSRAERGRAAVGAVGPSVAAAAPAASAAARRGDFAGVLPPPHSMWEADESWFDLDEFSKAVQAEVAYRAAAPPGSQSRRGSPGPKPLGSAASAAVAAAAASARADRAEMGALQALKAQSQDRRTSTVHGQAVPAADATASGRDSAPRKRTASPGPPAAATAAPRDASRSPPSAARRETRHTGPVRVAFGRRVEEPIKTEAPLARSSSPGRGRGSPKRRTKKAAAGKGKAGASAGAAGSPASTTDAVHQVLSALASALMSDADSDEEGEDEARERGGGADGPGAVEGEMERGGGGGSVKMEHRAAGGSVGDAAWAADATASGQAGLGHVGDAGGGAGAGSSFGPLPGVPGGGDGGFAGPGAGHGMAAPWLQPGVQPWPLTTVTARPRFQYVVDTAHPPITRLPAWAASAVKAEGIPAAYAAVVGEAPAGMGFGSPTRRLPAGAAAGTPFLPGPPMVAPGGGVGAPGEGSGEGPVLGATKLSYAYAHHQHRQLQPQPPQQQLLAFPAPADPASYTQILAPQAAAAAVAAAAAPVGGAGAGGRLAVGLKKKKAPDAAQQLEQALMQAVEDEVVSRLAVSQLAAHGSAATTRPEEVHGLVPPLVDYELSRQLVCDVLRDNLRSLLGSTQWQQQAQRAQEEAEQQLTLEEVVAALAAAPLLPPRAQAQPQGQQQTGQDAAQQQWQQQQQQQQMGGLDADAMGHVEQQPGWEVGQVAEQGPTQPHGQEGGQLPAYGEQDGVEHAGPARTAGAAGWNGEDELDEAAGAGGSGGGDAIARGSGAHGLAAGADDAHDDGRDAGSASEGSAAALGQQSSAAAAAAALPSLSAQASRASLQSGASLTASAASHHPPAGSAPSQTLARGMPPPGQTDHSHAPPQALISAQTPAGPAGSVAGNPAAAGAGSLALALPGSAQLGHGGHGQLQTYGVQAHGAQARGTQVHAVEARGTQAAGMEERATQAAGVKDSSSQADPPPPHYMLQAALAAGFSFGTGPPALPFGGARPPASSPHVGPDGDPMSMPRPYYLVPADGTQIQLPATYAAGLYGHLPLFNRLAEGGNRPTLNLPGLSKLRDSSDVESSSDSVRRHMQGPGARARAAAEAAMGLGPSASVDSSDDGLMQRSYAQLELASLTSRPVRLDLHRAALPDSESGSSVGPAAMRAGMGAAWGAFPRLDMGMDREQPQPLPLPLHQGWAEGAGERDNFGRDSGAASVGAAGSWMGGGSGGGGGGGGADASGPPVYLTHLAASDRSQRSDASRGSMGPPSSAAAPSRDGSGSGEPPPPFAPPSAAAPRSLAGSTARSFKSQGSRAGAGVASATAAAVGNSSMGAGSGFASRAGSFARIEQQPRTPSATSARSQAAAGAAAEESVGAVPTSDDARFLEGAEVEAEEDGAVMSVHGDGSSASFASSVAASVTGPRNAATQGAAAAPPRPASRAASTVGRSAASMTVPPATPPAVGDDEYVEDDFEDEDLDQIHNVDFGSDDGDEALDLDGAELDLGDDSPAPSPGAAPPAAAAASELQPGAGAEAGQGGEMEEVEGLEDDAAEGAGAEASEALGAGSSRGSGAGRASSDGGRGGSGASSHRSGPGSDAAGGSFGGRSGAGSGGRRGSGTGALQAAAFDEEGEELLDEAEVGRVLEAEDAGDGVGDSGSDGGAGSDQDDGIGGGGGGGNDEDEDGEMEDFSASTSPSQAAEVTVTSRPASASRSVRGAAGSHGLLAASSAAPSAAPSRVVSFASSAAAGSAAGRAGMSPRSTVTVPGAASGSDAPAHGLRGSTAGEPRDGSGDVDASSVRSSLERMARAGLASLEHPARLTAMRSDSVSSSVAAAPPAALEAAALEAAPVGPVRAASAATLRPALATLQPSTVQASTLPAGSGSTQQPGSPGKPPSLTDYHGPMGRLWRPAPAPSTFDPLLSSSSETLMASSEASGPFPDAVTRALQEGERRAAALRAGGGGTLGAAVARAQAAVQGRSFAGDLGSFDVSATSLDPSASTDASSVLSSSYNVAGVTPPRQQLAAARAMLARRQQELGTAVEGGGEDGAEEDDDGVVQTVDGESGDSGSAESTPEPPPRRTSSTTRTAPGMAAGGGSFAFGAGGGGGGGPGSFTLRGGAGGAGVGEAGREGSVFRLRQFGARRRKLMHQIGVKDPLLMSSGTSLSTDSSDNISDDDQ